MRFLYFILIFFNFLVFNSSTKYFKKQFAISKTNIKIFHKQDPKILCKNVIGVLNPYTKFSEDYILDNSIYDLKIDTFSKIKFWRYLMNLHEDTAILNFAFTRVMIQKIDVKTWDLKNDTLKKQYKDSILASRNLDTTNRIFLTTGKKYFYDFEKTSQNFNKGINCFIENNTDPWYAQAILLIESPNKLQKSNSGAYGSFQLMKKVAKLYGLKVNKTIDERENFERSAFAASSLIKTICIPEAIKMLDSLQIKNINENDLWFKLFVMHIYHAGAFNVKSAIFAIKPSKGDMNLIYNLWVTETPRFKNACQNYSQLIIAAMLEMNKKRNL